VVHVWEVEFGGMPEWIRDELFRINVGLWNYAKNHNPQVHEINARREMIWLNYVMGVRESRRLLGDYVLTENDYIQQTVHVSFQTRTDRGVDFNVQAMVDGGWKSVAEVRGNTDRRRVLGFSPVQTDKIRLVLLETAGNVGVCEVRLYRESP
jgi:hypothetical protein